MVTWYNDQSAKIAFDSLKNSIQPLVNENFPDHDLSHVGFNRSFDTDEIIIKLHIKPKLNINYENNLRNLLK